MPEWRTLQSALYQHRLDTDPAGAAAWAADVSAEADEFRGSPEAVIAYLVGRVRWTIPRVVVALIDAGMLSAPQAHGLLQHYGFDPEQALRIEREINNV